MNNSGNEYEMVTANNYVSDEQIARKNWKPIDDVPAVIFAKVGAAIMLNRKRLCRFPFLLDNNTMAYKFDKSWDIDFGRTMFEKLDLTTLVQVGALPSYNASDVERMMIAVPKDLAEQYEIGVFFRTIDHLITLHQRECDLLVKTKKSYLQKMFPKNGEDKPEIRFAGFTDAWEQREFGELLKEFSIKSKVEDEHTVLSSTNSGMEVRDGRVSGTSNLGYKIIENGDLVLSPQNLWIGNINVNDIGIGLVSPSYKTFKFVSVFGSFIEPQLRMPRLMEKYKNASTQGASVVRRNLELDSFYQITIRVPKSDEQRKIGDFFRQLDDLITLHQRELDSLKDMKKSLLQQMFI